MIIYIYKATYNVIIYIYINVSILLIWPNFGIRLSSGYLNITS